MLFKKIENFSSEAFPANCIIKFGELDAQITFYNSLWYIWHFDEIEFDEYEGESYFSLDSDDKHLVQTASNGVTDGFVYALDTEVTLNIVGKAKIFLIQGGVA